MKAIAQVDSSTGLTKAVVRRVTIRSRRLYVNGEAELSSGSVPFELSTGAGLKDDGESNQPILPDFSNSSIHPSLFCL